jgi:hypothetical protein
VNGADVITDDFIKTGRFEIGIADKKYAAKAHLRAPYDPGRKRILM